MDQIIEDEFIGNDEPIFEKYPDKEIKILDTRVNATTYVAQQSVIGSLNLISAGDAFNNRDGRFIKACGLRIRGMSIQSGGTANDYQTLYILQDRMCNGALPATSAIFQNTTAVDELNWLNRERFRVLYKESGSVGPQQSVYNNLDNLIKFESPITIGFNGTGGAITNVVSNNIIAVICSWNGSITFNGNFRLFFVDD